MAKKNISKMSKNEQVRRVAKAAGVSQVVASKVISNLRVVAEEVIEGSEYQAFSIVGIGTFNRKEIASQEGKKTPGIAKEYTTKARVGLSFNITENLKQEA